MTTADPQDAPTPKPDDPKEPAKEYKAPQTQEELDRIVQSRLAREREKFADYDDVKKRAEEFDKIQESQKTELQKSADAAAKAEQRATDAEMRALRLEVATEKGLSSAQAKRLVGANKQELEADADELLESFKPGDDNRDKPPGGPKETLRGGGDPTDEPGPNVRKVVEAIPRI